MDNNIGVLKINGVYRKTNMNTRDKTDMRYRLDELFVLEGIIVIHYRLKTNFHLIFIPNKSKTVILV